MRRETILIVEDNVIVATDLQGTLKRLGYSVLEPVATGEEAVSVVAAREPDMVLMDINLAGEMNGITAAECIRAASDVPVIYLTGYSEDSLVQEAKATAPYGYLVKPVSERELAVTIEMALHRNSLDRRLKESEAKLKKSEAMYRSVVEDQTELICRYDLEGKLTFVNEAYLRYYGKSRSEAIGESFVLHIPESDLRMIHEQLGRIDQNNPLAVFEHSIMAPDGGVRRQYSTHRGIFGADGGLIEYQAVGKDITDRKRIEEELRRSRDELELRVHERTIKLLAANRELRESEKQLRFLSSRLLTAQEEERKRLAGEIHDSIGSSLGAINFSLENIWNGMRHDTASSQAIEELMRITRVAMDDARRITMNLRPSMLDDLGLVATINWFVRRFEAIHGGLRIDKQIETADEDVPEDLKIVIFRMMEEAFHNIAKDLSINNSMVEQADRTVETVRRHD